MGWFQNLRIRTKLLLGFGGVCLLSIGLVAVAYFALAEIETIEREKVAESSQADATLRQLRSDENRIRGSMLGFVAFDDATARAAFKRDVEERTLQVDGGLAQIKAYLTKHKLEQELARLPALEQAITDYRRVRDTQYQLVAAGRADEALQLSAGIQAEQFENVRALVVAIGDGVQVRAALDRQLVEQLFERAVWILFGLASLAIVFSLFMTWLMTRTISRPIVRVTAVAERIAAADLSVQLPTEERSDEVGALLRALAVMLKNLRELNSELRRGFGVLASSSTEILTTVSQVAATAAETAAAVSQTSTTAEEVKQTAHLSNQKARAVQETSQSTTAVSESGCKAVAEAVEGMHHIQEQMASIAQSVLRLSEQGQAIGEIIATVNDLAEQSNLLAVNAAIEATRAGEYGKPFAVVAQEVRSLAEQSRQATTQVRTILLEVQKATTAAVMATEQGSKAVAAGVKQATGAGDAFRALNSRAAEAARAATQIAASSEQQLVGMDQIALAIGNIKQAAIQNMTGTRQLETSAQDLKQLGERLKQMIERQRLDAG